MRVRIQYSSAADLVRDHDQQLARGGLLLRVAPPAELDRGTLIDVELALPDGTVLVAQAPVTRVVGASAVAIGLRAGAVPGLAAVVAAARAHMSPPGQPPAHAWADEPGGDLERPAELTEPAPEHDPEFPTEAEDDAEAEADAEDDAERERVRTDAPSRVKQASMAKKIALALHGNKDERAAILRDLNKLFHPYVLRNPNLGIDEVLAIAKMTTLAGELLKTIAERREWASRPEVAIALVRNPKCAVPIALKVLGYVSPADLRQLAKDTKTRPLIQAAARKRLIS